MENAKIERHELQEDQRLGLPSCSQLPAIFGCAGFWVAEKEVESQSIRIESDSADSRRGTMLHKSNETGDVTLLDEDDIDLIERVRLSEEEITYQWLTDTESKMEDIEIHREIRLWAGGWSGQLDFAAIHRTKHIGLVIDLKTGRRTVSPPVRNFQLRGCAVLLHVNMGCESVRTAIVQPLLRKHIACQYEVDHLIAARAQIENRIAYVQQPNLPRTTGAHCDFCKAGHVCPELRKKMSVAIGARTLNWDLTTAPERVRLYKAAKMAKDCADLIIEHVRAELAANPDSLPGLKKAVDQRPRKVTDTLGLADLLVKTVIGDQDWTHAETVEAYRCFLKGCKISIKEAEAFYKSRMPSGSTAEAKRFLEGMAQEFITESTRSGAISVSEPEE